MHESGRKEVQLPIPYSKAPSPEAVKVVNYSGIFSDSIEYSENVPEGTEVSIYQARERGIDYVKLASKQKGSGNIKFEFSDSTVLGADAGKIYIAVKFPGFLESEKTAVAYEAEPLSMKVGMVRIDPDHVNRLTVYNIQTDDIIRIYQDSECTTLLASQTCAGNRVDFTLSSCSDGDTVYITNQGRKEPESEALPIVLANLKKGCSQSMNEQYASRTFSFDVDFSGGSKPTIFVSRLSGGTEMSFEVQDATEAKPIVKNIGEDNQDGNYYNRNYLTLEKPAGMTQDTATYTVTVKAGKYLEDIRYKIVLGDLSETADIYGEKENVMDIKKYYSMYSTGNPTYWQNELLERHYPGMKGNGTVYRFRYFSNYTITLMGRRGDMGFRIYDPDDDKTDIFNTEDDSRAIRDNCKNGYSFVMKADKHMLNELREKGNLREGWEYCIEVYSLSKSSGEYMDDAVTYSLAIGEPVMLPAIENLRVYSSRQYTLSNYQNVTTSVEIKDAPKTAIVNDILPIDGSRQYLSQLMKISTFNFRNRAYDFPWIAGKGFVFPVEFDAKVTGSLQIPVNGIWDMYISVQRDEVTIRPGLQIGYIYEVGD